ncbi:hypothetical protein F4859DRAFT_274454 [Xylaria cf. heliscus]|nr:hypothetical protein F4859DRAFT_274454 [Xylaria cf. heliscus]
MDTPRSNLGDATYLGRPPPDFDMTQEPSFQSPSKDNNLVQQLRNGRALNLRTPRGSRAPLGDRRNLPAGIGGSEFTPMLKSATRNSARRRGKENTNGLATPALGKIDEDMDMTNVPVESSLFGPSRNMSYVAATPLPEVEASSTASTPMVQPTRRRGDKGPLQDGNQLSLREQENVIDKIEKENFGLKLKIHFLEEALRKTGPGFSEAALKENTELKVDKVTMQRELSKYKKHLASAEKDLETYQQQILDVQERAKKKYADQNQKAENDALRRGLEEREAEIETLQRQLEQQSQDDGKVDQLRGEIGDLEADLRAKDREVDQREEEMDELRTKLKETEDDLHHRLEEREAEIENLQRQLQQQSQDNGKVGQLHGQISDLEADLRAKDREVDQREEEIDGLRTKLDDMEDTLRHRLEEREAEIERLQRQLQQESQDGSELGQIRSNMAHLEADLRTRNQELNDCEEEIDELQRKLEEIENSSRRQLEDKEVEIQGLRQQQSQGDNKADQLRRDMAILEADLRAKSHEANEYKKEIGGLETSVENLQRQLQLSQSDNTADQLRREVAVLEADLRAKGHEANEYKKEVGGLETTVKSLQRQLQLSQSDNTVDQLREKVAVLEAGVRAKDREINDRENELRRELETKQSALVSLRNEVSGLRNDLDRSQADRETQSEKMETLENEVKVLRAALDKESGDTNQQLRLADDLRRELETKQSTLASLRNEVSDLRDKLRHSETERQTQSEKIEALEDKVEVLQATLDEESEDASQRLRQADELCQDLRRQLRDNIQRTNRLTQLEGTDKVAEALRQDLEQTKQQLHEVEQECEDADTVVEMLKQQLEETKQSLHDAEQECEELKRKIDGASRQESKEVTHANQATEDLKRQLLRAQKESKKAELLCEDLRAQLSAARQELDYANPLCKELRQKLDRARRERAEYQASAKELQFDCDRLKKDAQETLAWIQARNAEKPSFVAPRPIKQAAMATFRYGDVVMDVVDQKDHEAVIRAADSAQRRHKKEIRGMELQILWMQARWERESKLRNNGASAKKYLQLQLEIADACNKAQLRRLDGIHQKLGLKSPAELVSLKRQKDRKPLNKLRVFVTVIRAVARMRVDAQKWGEHEKTRLRLDAAWEEKKQQQLLY